MEWPRNELNRKGKAWLRDAEAWKRRATQKKSKAVSGIGVAVKSYALEEN